MMAVLRPAFESQEMTIAEVCWDDSNARWYEFDAAVVGTTWDYWDRSALFISTLEKIESQTRLMNSVSTVKWNSDKRYLNELAALGAELIPTVWIESPTEDSVLQAFDVLGCNDMVIKRQVGAGAAGQYRLRRGEAIPELDRPMMAQPFLTAIQTEGEISLIFIDGEFSHGLVKRAQEGDYRIQSSYGGTEQAIKPNRSDLASAKRIVDSLKDTPLYARVDMLRSGEGELFLMELELIEPYLYPVEGPQLGTLMAGAVKRRIDNS